MFDALKSLMGMGGGEPDFTALIGRGAQIIDVRSAAEFAGGHIESSLNIPVQSLPTQLGRIRKDKPVITCCASGMRSATAKRILEAGGFAEVHNGGAWRGLLARIKT